MPESRPRLPKLLLDMSEAFDLATALRFAQRFGGLYLTMPKRARADHPVAQHCGQAVLAWLIDQHDEHAYVKVPSGAWAARQAMQDRVAEMTAAGSSANRIAQALAVQVRVVERLRQRIAREAQARQGSLALDVRTGGTPPSIGVKKASRGSDVPRHAQPSPNRSARPAVAASARHPKQQSR